MDVDNKLDDSPQNNAALLQLIAAEVGRMRALEVELDATKARIASYRYSLGQARHLPPELLQIIFRHCVSSDLCDKDDTHSTHDPRRAPLVLTQICSTWREIALDTPSLWSRFVINYDDFSWPAIGENIRKMLEFWTARWRGHSHRMAIYGDQLDRYKDIFRILWDALSLNSTSISDLALHLPYSLFDAFSHLPAYSFSNLETLMIVPTFTQFQEDADDYLLWSQNTRALETAPKLHTVDIILDSDYEVPTLRLPWHQLYSLDLHPFDLLGDATKGMWSVLKLCACLRMCHVGFSQDDVESGGSIIQFKYLETFSVLLTDFQCIPIFDKMALPSLLDLTMTLGLQYAIPSFRPLIRMLQHSKCSLKSLFLHSISTVEELLDIFANIPTLSRLRLFRPFDRMDTWDTPVEDLIVGLTIKEGIHPILPSLEAFYLEDSHIRANNSSSFIFLSMIRRMIRSRGWANGKAVDEQEQKLKLSYGVVKITSVVIQFGEEDLRTWSEIPPGFRFRGNDLDLEEED